jgi:hypothetical protein
VLNADWRSSNNISSSSILMATEISLWAMNFILKYLLREFRS